MKTSPGSVRSRLAAALPAQAMAASAGRGVPFEQRCEQRDAADLRSQRCARPGYRVDNTVSSRVLNNRSVHHYAGELMLGMTALEARTEVIFDGPALADPATGRECVAPRISVDLVFPRMSVFVAREFAPSSCSYRKILEHEMRHVQLYRDQFPLARNALARGAGGALWRAPAVRRRAAPAWPRSSPKSTTGCARSSGAKSPRMEVAAAGDGHPRKSRSACRCPARASWPATWAGATDLPR